MFREAYCRNCGVLLRGAFGHWWHAQRFGPVPCPGAEPEPEGESESPPSRD